MLSRSKLSPMQKIQLLLLIMPFSFEFEMCIPVGSSISTKVGEFAVMHTFILLAANLQSNMPI